jgi:hypothetical protein
MFTRKPVYAALVAAIAASLVGATFSAASAVEPNGSDAAIYLRDANTAELLAPGTVLQYNDDVIGSPDDQDYMHVWTGSADAVEPRLFVSARGQERTISAWKAYAPQGFPTGSKDVLLPSMKLSGLINGNIAGVKDAGGEYSLGFAFVKNNGLTIADAGVVYTHITVTPGTGAWTFASPSSSTPTTPAVGSADINLSATTIAAADGTLSLDVPANATAVIGSPTLVDQLSTSTGVLGEFTVKDSRIATHKGWTLTSTVKDFVAGASTIPAARLSVTPKIVAAKTTAAGVTAAAAAAASTTGTPFAEASDVAAVGDTVLNADLKFVAPATAAAGTYTSKMTLTLVSK